jgi:PAS domain S-box-containing protein
MRRPDPLRFHNGLPLGLVVSLSIAVLIPLAISLLSHSFLDQLKREARSEAEHNALMLAQSLTSALSQPLAHEQFDVVEQVTADFAKSGFVQQLRIASPEGRILFAVTAEQSVERVITEVQYFRKTETEHLTPYRQSLTKTDHVLVTFPINSNDVMGWVELTYSFKNLLARFDTIKDEIQWIAIIISLLTILIMLGLLYPVQRSLRELAKFAQHLADSFHLVALRGQEQKLRHALPWIRETRQLGIALQTTERRVKSQFHILAEEGSRREALLRATPNTLLTLNQHGVITELNSAGERLLQIPAVNAIGLHALDVFKIDDYSEEAFGELLHSQQTVGESLRLRFHIHLQHVSAEPIWIAAAISPFWRDERLYYLLVITNIEDQIQVEREKQRAEDRLREILNRMRLQQQAMDEHAIISIANTDGEITYINKLFTRISGYSEAELMGQNHRVLRSGLHPPSFYRNLWRTISNGRIWRGEIANRARNGEIYWVSSTIVPMKDLDGKITEYISIRTDITANKLAEKALQEARQRELVVGRQIQATLLAGDLPDYDSSELRIATLSQPAQDIAGDFHEIIPMSEGRYDLITGDVMGKGVPAALVGAAFKKELYQVLTELFSKSNDDPPLEAILSALHQEMTATLFQLETFITLSYLRIDPEHERLSLINAGHTHALLNLDGELRTLEGDNMPLGASRDEVFHAQHNPFPMGSSLLLYSDGLTEARNSAGEEFGFERLSQEFQKLDESGIPVRIMIEALQLCVADFTDHSPAQDDQTLILVHHPHPLPDGHIFGMLSLEWDLASLQTLRTALKHFADRAQVPEQLFLQLQQAAIEVATNIMRHAQRLIDTASIHIRFQGAPNSFEVDFWHLGNHCCPDQDREPDFSGASDGGFGLFIIRESVSEVHYEQPYPNICNTRLIQRWNPH